MIYLNQEARIGLWNFITAHFSMIDQVVGNTYKNEPIAFTLDDSDITETIQPFFMARIVDVEQFLAHYPFENEASRFILKYSTPLQSGITGFFRLAGLKKVAFK